MNVPLTAEGYYASVLHMNNIGVTLLQNGAFRQALDTFKDATPLMQRVLPQTRPASPKDQPKEVILCRLKQAKQRLSHLKLNPSSLTVEALCIQDTDAAKRIQSILKYGPSPSLYYPIYTTEPTIFEERDADIDSAILLYNFALCHICLSRVSCAEKLLQAAHRLLVLSLSILEHRAETCDDIFHQSAIVLLASIVTKNMAQVLFEMNRIDEAELAFSRLEELTDLVDSIDDEFFAPPISAAAAA